MTFAEAIKSCYQKYATLTGRASRSEFWYFNLFFYGPIVCCGLVAGMMASGESLAEWLMYGIWAITIFSLVNFLPLLAVSVRRLHDVNMSGWWLLIRIVPLLGDLYLLIKFCTKGDVGSNRYGVAQDSGKFIKGECGHFYDHETNDHCPYCTTEVINLECTSGQYKGCKFPLTDQIVIGTDPSRCSIVVDGRLHKMVEPVHCSIAIFDGKIAMENRSLSSSIRYHQHEPEITGGNLYYLAPGGKYSGSFRNGHIDYFQLETDLKFYFVRQIVKCERSDCRVDAPLTYVRTTFDAELDVRLVFNTRFSPAEPTFPKPSTITNASGGVIHAWKICVDKGGIIKTTSSMGEVHRVNMIWWEAVRHSTGEEATGTKPACVPVSELKEFLTLLLAKAGLRENELIAFVNYWHEVFLAACLGGESYVLVEFVDKDEQLNYLPEMEVAGRDGHQFELIRFYFRFKVVDEFRGIDSGRYLEQFTLGQLGQNVVIDLGGEIVSESDIGNKMEMELFHQSFIKNYVLASV